jgi:hypothetical protein
MSISAGKLAPSVVVVAFVGYCAWPSVSHLVSGPSISKAAGKATELATALFAPRLGPPPTKNPFGGLDADSLAQAAKDGQPRTKGTDDKKNGAKTAARRVDPLAGLKLDATGILGDQRMAVINGEIYTPNQTISGGDPAMPPRKIVRVLPHMVVLECQGRMVELKYSNVGNSPEPPGKAATARPGDAAEPSLLSKLKKLSAASNSLKPAGKTPSTKAGN